MPSTATITAFYSFTANTKARANYVNTNFSNFRGHIIAIDPNTSTAATTETYDLGSTEYRWRTGYFREIDLKSNTSTGQALQMVGDTAAGNGAFNFHIGSTLSAQVGVNGFQGNLYGYLNKPFGFTTTGSSGQYSVVYLPTSTLSPLTGTDYVIGASITITSVGRPIECCLYTSATDTSNLLIIGMTTSGAGALHTGRITIKLFRNSTVVDIVKIGHSFNTNSSNTVYLGKIFLHDLSAPSGTNIYRIQYKNNGENSYLYTEETYFSAREI